MFRTTPPTRCFGSATASLTERLLPFVRGTRSDSQAQRTPKDDGSVGTDRHVGRPLSPDQPIKEGVHIHAGPVNF